MMIKVMFCDGIAEQHSFWVEIASKQRSLA